jgi:hypothetical protein
VGEASSVVAMRPVTATKAAQPAATATTSRTTQTPALLVRTSSTIHPTACAATVQVPIQASVRASAAQSPGTGPTVHAVTASRVTACTDQAMFNGAVTSAPR